MKDRDQSPRNQRPSLGRKLALGGAIGVGALANLAPAALANKVNAQAQSAATRLARRIISGELSATAGVSYAGSRQGGRQLVDSTVIVDGGKPPKGGQPGAYKFTVLAPAKPNGNPDLNHVMAVTAAEGQVDAIGNITAPYTQVNLVKNNETGSWAILANRQTKGGDAIAEAGAIPVEPHEASLTGADVTASFHLVNDGMIGSAIHGDAVSAPGLPFHQPPGTVVNLLK